MTEGKIVSWIKSKGDKLSKGESVVVPESDKADMDVETFYDDILAAIVKSDGEIASVVVATPYVIAPETTASPPPPAKSVSDGPRKTVAMPQANKVAKEQKKGFFSPSFFNIERYEDRDRNILGRR